MGPSTYTIGVPVTNNIDSYRKAKLKILKRDFYIKLTPEEIEHANELKSEIAIDQFCLSAINRHWG